VERNQNYFNHVLFGIRLEDEDSLEQMHGLCELIICNMHMKRW